MTMTISGVLVHASHTQLTNIEKNLSEINGVEVHTVTDDGRIVVTVEGDSSNSMADTMVAFNNIKGVYSTAMIYQYSDDDIDED